MTTGRDDMVTMTSVARQLAGGRRYRERSILADAMARTIEDRQTHVTVRHNLPGEAGDPTVRTTGRLYDVVMVAHTEPWLVIDTADGTEWVRVADVVSMRTTRSGSCDICRLGL